jgi:hypothetical protein
LFCSSCGAKSELADNFCSRCGKKLNLVGDVSPTEAIAESRSEKSESVMEGFMRGYREGIEEKSEQEQKSQHMPPAEGQSNQSTGAPQTFNWGQLILWSVVGYFLSRMLYEYLYDLLIFGQGRRASTPRLLLTSGLPAILLTFFVFYLGRLHDLFINKKK